GSLVGHANPDRALVLVCLPFVDEPPRLLLAALDPVELEGDLAVPVQAEPAQRLLDVLRRLLDLAARVGVLDPQAELTALVPGEEPVEERGVNAADVQEAGRARSHADDGRHAGSVGACARSRSAS